MEPLIRMPSWLAPPIPAKKLRGMLTTSAHGQLVTRNVSARYTHCSHWPSMPPTSRITGGIIASASAL